MSDKTQLQVPGVFKDPPPPSRLAASESSLARTQGGSSSLQRSKSQKNNSLKPMSKTLSRSHDNLASQLRKKATAAALEGRGESPSRRQFKHPKSPVPPDATPPMRKAVSSQSINKADDPMTRTQSAQNISSASAGVDGAPGPMGMGGDRVKRLQHQAAPPKRAMSTQNISNKHKSRQARLAASGQNAMAYNAELLASFEKEKKGFERHISELRKESENRKTEIERMRIELRMAKEKIPSESEQEETKRMRSKLNELGVNLSDINNVSGGGTNIATDKHPSNSSDLKDAPIDPGASTLGTCDSERAFSVISDLSCPIPEHPAGFSSDQWDRHSNKSDALSEISVACLQDRISQMEETHYSTNEELQATLHELKDLQDTVNELASENEILNDEKAILLESLCAQTEKLENYRLQVEHLKHLVVSESERSSRSTNERELVALIKMGQEEKEELLLRQMELSNSLHRFENENRDLQDVIRAMQDKQKLMEHKKDSLASDKRALESQLAELKEQNAKEHIDTTRFKTLLENEKQKVVELEQYHKATDKSEIEELLSNTRQEKERLEERLANKQEEVEMTRNEVMRLNEQIQSHTEQMKVLKNNTKTEVHDFEYRMKLRDKEKQDLQEEISTLREHIDQLQLDCDRYLEERRTHSTVVNKFESDLKGVKQKLSETESEMKDLKNKYSEDMSEWKQLHSDLLMTVVIANDIKTEAQERTEQITAENQFLRERTDSLQEELVLVQNEFQKIQREKEQVSGIRGRVLNTVDRELQSLRLGRDSTNLKDGGKQAISVKQLIYSIEEQVQNPSLSPTYSPLSPTMPTIEATPRRNSTESLNSIKSDFSTEQNGESRRQSDTGNLKNLLRNKENNKDSRQSMGHRHTISNIIYESAPAPVTDIRASPSSSKFDSPEGSTGSGSTPSSAAGKYASILKDSTSGRVRHTSFGEKEKSPEKQPLVFTSTAAQGIKSDPLAILAKLMGGSKRNALLKWCQQRTANYPGIDITNFSSSWNDGLAFCALLHSYLPKLIPFKELNSQDKMRNFSLAFKAGESVNIPSFLDASDMAALDRPDWQAVMSYVTSVYKHFEVDNKP